MMPENEGDGCIDEKKRSEKQLHASFGEKFVQAAVQLCRHGSNANHARRRSARAARARKQGRQGARRLFVRGHSSSPVPARTPPKQPVGWPG